jgi:hypothetical protein
MGNRNAKTGFVKKLTLKNTRPIIATDTKVAPPTIVVAVLKASIFIASS